jgi:hypothetical protein
VAHLETTAPLGGTSPENNPAANDRVAEAIDRLALDPVTPIDPGAASEVVAARIVPDPERPASVPPTVVQAGLYSGEGELSSRERTPTWPVVLVSLGAASLVYARSHESARSDEEGPGRDWRAARWWDRNKTLRAALKTLPRLPFSLFVTRPRLASNAVAPGGLPAGSPVPETGTGESPAEQTQRRTPVASRPNHRTAEATVRLAR